MFPTPVTAARWRKWAATSDGIEPLLARIETLGVRRSRAKALVDGAICDPSWRSLARLDAATRMAMELQERNLLARGAASERLLFRLLGKHASSDSEDPIEIPEHFFWVTPDPNSSEHLVARGSVLVHFSGLAPLSKNTEDHEYRNQSANRPVDAPTAADESPREQSVAWTDPKMRHAVEKELERPTLRPFWFLWLLFRHDAGTWLAFVTLAVVCSAAIVPLEALLMQALATLAQEVGQQYQRAAGLAAVITLLGAGLACDWWGTRTVQVLARRLESRVRAAFLWQLPRLSTSYLRSRPSSDMAGRGNVLHVIRVVPIV